MKPVKLITLLIVLAITGGAALFAYHKTLPDIDHIHKDISQRILTIEGLNSNVSELAIRSRYNLDHNYDALTRATLELDQAVEEFSATYYQQANQDGDILEKRWLEFKSELESKKDLIEFFKSHNSVLRNSEKYAPTVGNELIQAASKENLEEPRLLYSEITRELLRFSLHGSAESLEILKFKLPLLLDIEKLMPDYTLTSAIEFSNHVQTVINEKYETDTYLRKILLSNSDSRLEILSSEWSNWVQNQNASKNQFNYIMMGYIGFLLLAFIMISVQLRRLYNSLDQQVIKRTDEVKKAYKDLKDSEAQMVQNEKMASLGQLVAGLAHEINTPLGYISNNVTVIQGDMKQLNSCLQVAELLSDEISQPKPDNKKLIMLLKNLVKEFRIIKRDDVYSEIIGLLEDSSFGLNEITELVKSLKDFSRIDSGNMIDSDIHLGIDSTIKICKNIIGNRTITQRFTDNMPKIECMPTQLNQVFMNIVNNAVQATHAETGTLNIKTSFDDKDVYIEFIDNGDGMSEETIKKIFDPFYTTKDVGEGTGLGMSISYKIIESHNGEISVESTIYEGSTITVRLPIRQAKIGLSIVH